MADVSAPRFLFLVGVGIDQDARPAWPGRGLPFVGEPGADGSWLAWRLVGGNHRELGRSSRVFADLGLARNSALLIRENVTDLDTTIRTGSTGIGWTWRASLSGEVVATSSRGYARQREATYNLDVFLAAADLAELSDVVAGFRRAVPAPRPALELDGGVVSDAFTPNVRAATGASKIRRVDILLSSAIPSNSNDFALEDS